jgi:hypothetical protein
MTLEEPVSPPKTPSVFQTPPMFARKRKPCTVTPPRGLLFVQQRKQLDLATPLVSSNSQRKKPRSGLLFPPPMLPNSADMEGIANPFSKKIRPMHSPITGLVSRISLDFMPRLQGEEEQGEEELTTSSRVLPSRRTVAAVSCFPDLEDDEPQHPRVLNIKMRRRTSSNSRRCIEPDQF